MGLVVTAIGPGSAAAALTAALRAAEHSLEPLQVVTAGDPPGGMTRALAGDGIILGTTGTGTGVPGLTTSAHGAGGLPGLQSHEYLPANSTSERLGALEIPDDEAEGYAEALEAGRSVYAYFARPDTVEGVAAVFRSVQDLTKIRVF